MGLRTRAGVKSLAGGRTDAIAPPATARGTAAAANAGATASGDRDDDSDAEDPGDLAGGGTHTASRHCAVRRAVLLGIAASGAAALTGCGDDDGDPSSRAGDAGRGGTSASPSGPPTTEPSLEPFPGADDGGDGGDGNATGLVKTDEVPVGGAVLAGDYLIAQPQRGVFKAFDATCPHQGVTVDPPAGTNDYFMCPGHNSKFRLSDGSRISGPAPRGLKPVAVKVSNGYVVEA
jgi:nitrite reductase/ring-hydroxylating ferredoxin subunit